MIDLHDAAQRINDDPVVIPAPVEAIYRRAREIRRRSRLRVGATVALVGLVGALTGSALTSGPPHRIRIATTPEPSTTTVPRQRGGSSNSPPTSLARPPAVPPPAELVAHLPTGTARPGQIVVINTATGAVVKVLGADYDPYVGDGFHIAAGGQSVFWTHLNEQAQQFPVTEVPLDGGAGRTIANGVDDLPSPAGTSLLLGNTGTFQIVDLASGKSRPLPVPALDGQAFASASWLPDGHTVLALSVTPVQQCEGPVVHRCPTTTTIPAEAKTRAWAIDAATPNAQWVVEPSDGLWDRVELLGPGRLPGTAAGYQTDGTNPIDLLTIRSNGTIVDRVPINANQVQVLAVDHSGTNFLIANNTGLARLSLADPNPVHVGAPVAEATWW